FDPNYIMHTEHLGEIDIVAALAERRHIIQYMHPRLLSAGCKPVQIHAGIRDAAFVEESVHGSDEDDGHPRKYRTECNKKPLLMAIRLLTKIDMNELQDGDENEYGDYGSAECDNEQQCKYRQCVIQHGLITFRQKYQPRRIDEDERRTGFVQSIRLQQECRQTEQC